MRGKEFVMRTFDELKQSIIGHKIVSAEGVGLFLDGFNIVYVLDWTQGKPDGFNNWYNIKYDTVITDVTFEEIQEQTLSNGDKLFYGTVLIHHENELIAQAKCSMLRTQDGEESKSYLLLDKLAYKVFPQFTK